MSSKRAGSAAHPKLPNTDLFDKVLDNQISIRLADAVVECQAIVHEAAECAWAIAQQKFVRMAPAMQAARDVLTEAINAVCIEMEPPRSPLMMCPSLLSLAAPLVCPTVDSRAVGFMSISQMPALSLPTPGHLPRASRQSRSRTLTQVPPTSVSSELAGTVHSSYALPSSPQSVESLAATVRIPLRLRAARLNAVGAPDITAPPETKPRTTQPRSRNTGRATPGWKRGADREATRIAVVIGSQSERAPELFPIRALCAPMIQFAPPPEQPAMPLSVLPNSLELAHGVSTGTQNYQDQVMTTDGLLTPESAMLLTRTQFMIACNEEKIVPEINELATSPFGDAAPAWGATPSHSRQAPPGRRSRMDSRKGNMFYCLRAGAVSRSCKGTQQATAESPGIRRDRGEKSATLSADLASSTVPAKRRCVAAGSD